MYQNRQNSMLTWMYQESDLNVSKDGVNKPVLTSCLVQKRVSERKRNKRERVSEKEREKVQCYVNADKFRPLKHTLIHCVNLFHLTVLFVSGLSLLLFLILLLSE